VCPWRSCPLSSPSEARGLPDHPTDRSHVWDHRGTSSSAPPLPGNAGPHGGGRRPSEAVHGPGGLHQALSLVPRGCQPTPTSRRLAPASPPPHSTRLGSGGPACPSLTTGGRPTPGVWRSRPRRGVASRLPWPPSIAPGALGRAVSTAPRPPDEPLRHSPRGDRRAPRPALPHVRLAVRGAPLLAYLACGHRAGAIAAMPPRAARGARSPGRRQAPARPES